MDKHKNKKNRAVERYIDRLGRDVVEACAEVLELRRENAKLREDLNWWQVEAVARTNTRWAT